MIPKYPREVMSVDTHDSADLERPFLTHVKTVCLYVHSTIIVRVSYVSNPACEDSAVACTILNFYFLIHLYSPVNNLFYAHISTVPVHLLLVAVP